MSDINFLNNQNHDDQEPKTKDDLKEKLAWSKPEKETKSFKSAGPGQSRYLSYGSKP